MTSSRRTVLVAGALAFAGCNIDLNPVILRPSSNFRLIPSDLNYQYEEKTLPMASDGVVSLWRIRATGTSKGIIVVIPGNDANKGRYSVVLPIFVDKGWDVVLFDYPGFGKSPGTPTLDGLLQSTRAVLDYALDDDDVVVGVGVSLGTGVLARVAVDYPLAACIFESTTNLWALPSEFLKYHDFLPELGGLADLVAQAGTSPDFDMKRWIVDVKAPKLFLHSPDDSVTPWTEAWDVFKLAPQPKHMVATQGDHAQQIFVDPNLYRSVINGWLDGILKLDPIQNPGFQQLLDSEIRATLEEYGLAPKG